MNLIGKGIFKNINKDWEKYFVGLFGKFIINKINLLDYWKRYIRKE